MKDVLKALAEVKKEVGKLTKKADNPFFKSKYFDINQLIDQTEPLFEKNGLILLQPIKQGFVISEIHHIETGEMVSSEIKLPELNDPQKIGSAITYYRRYSLQSLLGLQAEDDDGNKASAPVKVLTPTEKLNACKTLAELKTVYDGIANKTTEVTALKDKLKTTLK